jgi:hypothetical protein
MSGGWPTTPRWRPRRVRSACSGSMPSTASMWRRGAAPVGGSARILTPSAFPARAGQPWCSILRRAWWRKARCA